MVSHNARLQYMPHREPSQVIVRRNRQDGGHFMLLTRLPNTTGKVLLRAGEETAQAYANACGCRTQHHLYDSDQAAPAKNTTGSQTR